MSIVLKENEWAEQMIEARDLGKSPAETLQRVSRHYLDEGYSKSEARKKVEIYLLQSRPDASLVKWSGMLDAAMNRAEKYPAADIDAIQITKPEMDKIDTVKPVQGKRLAFTLLCLAKYWKIVRPEMDWWVTNENNEIMRMANIGTSLKRQGLLFKELADNGMLQFPKRVDSTSVRVLFAEDGEVVLSVTDFRNLGYQYLKYHGGPYIQCKNCGITVKMENPKKGRRQQYCADCKKMLNAERAITAMRKKREDYAKKRMSELHTYTVYMHETPDDKRYIGITSTTPVRRWNGGLGYSSNMRFYDDIVFFGWNNIKHYIIAEVDDKNLAEEISKCYISRFKTYEEEFGYNRKLHESKQEYDENLFEQYPARLIES